MVVMRHPLSRRDSAAIARGSAWRSEIPPKRITRRALGLLDHGDGGDGLGCGGGELLLVAVEDAA
jgi:hypothetical protein